MLSEAEMKEFFQRVVDSVATLSSQASRVDGLEAKVNELSNRISTLEQENYRLVQQAQDANNMVAQVSGELAHAKSQYETERHAVSALQEAIFQRDSKVQVYESELQAERDSNKITTSERDDARTKVQELEAELARFREALNGVTSERNEWRNKAIDAESKTNDLQQRLDKVQAILSPLRVVASADVA